jgi:hypothetical protein
MAGRLCRVGSEAGPVQGAPQGLLVARAGVGGTATRVLRRATGAGDSRTGHYQGIGACDERCTQFVRGPLPHEHPASGSPYGTGTIHPRF